MASVTIKEGYKLYKQKGGTVSYGAYREICSEFNQYVMERLIVNAEVFHMPFRLSILQVVMRDRHPNAKRMDWKASHERRAELVTSGITPKGPDHPNGKPWFVYRLDDEPYASFFWKKAYVLIQNKTVYCFEATRGEKGNKNALSKHLIDSPYARLEYESK